MQTSWTVALAQCSWGVGWGEDGAPLLVRCSLCYLHLFLTKFSSCLWSQSYPGLGDFLLLDGRPGSKRARVCVCVCMCVCMCVCVYYIERLCQVPGREVGPCGQCTGLGTRNSWVLTDTWAVAPLYDFTWSISLLFHLHTQSYWCFPGCQVPAKCFSTCEMLAGSTASSDGRGSLPSSHLTFAWLLQLGVSHTEFSCSDGKQILCNFCLSV